MFRPTLPSTLISSLLLAWLALAPTAQAAGADSGWHARFSAIWVDPEVGFIDIDTDQDRLEADADNELGLGISLERRVGPRFGVEAGLLFAEPQLGLDAALAGIEFSASDRVSFKAVTAGLNWHLTPDHAVDLYVGPLLSYVAFGDLGLDVSVPGGSISERFTSDDDFALGAQIGLDIGFGDNPWSLNLAARYLDTTLEVTDRDGETTDLGFEPLILSVGLGVRF